MDLPAIECALCGKVRVMPSTNLATEVIYNVRPCPTVEDGAEMRVTLLDARAAIAKLATAHDQDSISDQVLQGFIKCINRTIQELDAIQDA